MQKVSIKIQKMRCPSCAFRLDGELEDSSGVKSAKTSYHTCESNIEFDEQVTSLDIIKKVIKKSGYDTD